eukprot:scaffold592874_cov34-Prasinocladus_malaysianus.AAC.1
MCHEADPEWLRLACLLLGPFKPTLRMSKVSKFAMVAARDCNIQAGGHPLLSSCVARAEVHHQPICAAL